MLAGEYGICRAFNDTNKDVVPFDMVPPFGVTIIVGTCEVELMKSPLKRLPDDKCGEAVWQPASVVNRLRRIQKLLWRYCGARGDQFRLRWQEWWSASHLCRTQELTYDDGTQTKGFSDTFISESVQESSICMKNEPIRCIGQPATGDYGFQGGMPPGEVRVVSCWIRVLLPGHVRVERLDALNR